MVSLTQSSWRMDFTRGYHWPPLCLQGASRHAGSLREENDKIGGGAYWSFCHLSMGTVNTMQAQSGAALISDMYVGSGCGSNQ